MSVRRRHKLLAIVLLLFFVGIGIRYFLWSIRLLDMNGGNHLQHSTDDVLARLARGDVAELEGLASLDLTNRGLTTFPMQILALKDSLEILNLGGNKLTTLPDEVLQFRKLRVLFLGSNEFERIPPLLGRLTTLYMLSFKSNKLVEICNECLSPSVGWLILTDNKLRSLPTTIGRLTGLRKLMLANNDLQSLPPELSLCKEIELIRLSRNKLTEFPSWLFQLPKLSWLALSGNPASSIRAPAAESSSVAATPSIPFSSLEVGSVLGQGASGIVYAVGFKNTAISDAQHNQFNYDLDRFEGTAVKLFKGDCSSDGHPSDEVYVSSLVGSVQPNILPVLASISEPDPSTVNGMKYGLVFPMIPQHCHVLASPPSFATVTRDVYSEHKVFSLRYALRIASGIASACSYLHSIGVMHGDIYGHNIHVYEDGTPILVDFGAASAYSAFSAHSGVLDIRARYENLEARAFGCLLEEIIERTVLDSNESGGVGQYVVGCLQTLLQRCLDISPERRPPFSEINEAIDSCVALLPA